MLISEVTELLIRDYTSRTTPAGVSSRGALLLREAEPKAAWLDIYNNNKRAAYYSSLPREGVSGSFAFGDEKYFFTTHTYSRYLLRRRCACLLLWWFFFKSIWSPTTRRHRGETGIPNPGSRIPDVHTHTHTHTRRPHSRQPHTQRERDTHPWSPTHTPATHPHSHPHPPASSSGGGGGGRDDGNLLSTFLSLSFDAATGLRPFTDQLENRAVPPLRGGGPSNISIYLSILSKWAGRLHTLSYDDDDDDALFRCLLSLKTEGKVWYL